MVKTYKRKTSQASWSEVAMARAMQEVKDGVSQKSTAKKYGIPLTTLRRHLKSGSSVKKLGRFKTVFTPQQEQELLEYVFHMDNLFFGLTKTDFLQLVYQFAEANNIKHPFKNGSAGEDFYKGFVLRNPDLTLRRPEPTSIARARGFNKPQVYRFFDLHESLIEKNALDPTRVYNMDETGVQTSTNKPPRILTKSGKKQVGIIASHEKGTTTTIVCCCNAAGAFVPPLIIYKRKRMASFLLDGAPPGTQATVSDNGWINGPVFTEWLRFFIETVRPTAERKVLLILDNHVSHRYLPALELASNHHVIFLSLPPHTTHRMQPLDYCVYGPLKTYFEQAVTTWQKAHTGRVVNQRDVAGLFGTAYLKAATTQNAVSGFLNTGLWPSNRYIFNESDFLPATTMENPDYVQDIAETANQQPQPPISYKDKDVSRTPSPSIIDQMIEQLTQPTTLQKPEIPTTLKNPEIDMTMVSASPLPVLDDQVIEILERAEPLSVGRSVTPDNIIDTNSAARDVLEIMPKSDSNVIISSTESHKSPLMLRPVPKMTPNLTSRRRKTQRAEILTSTPIKNELREKMNKNNKEKDKIKKAKKNFKENLRPKAKIKNASKSISKSSAASSSSKHLVAADGENSSGGNYICIMCMEPYVHPPCEDWICCDECKQWAHEACTSYTGFGSYFCDNCQEN